jgi:hypothetical protein
MALAAAPSDTNTTENPSTKKSDAITTRRRESPIAAAPRCRCLHIVQRDAGNVRKVSGISGRTHGDTNDNSPRKTQ